MSKRTSATIFLGCAALLLVLAGSLTLALVNRPKYRAVCEFSYSPSYFKLTISIKTVDGKFDLEECRGVVTAYKNDGTLLPVKLPFTIKDGESGLHLDLSPYYFGQEMYDVEAELTEIINKSGPGQEIAGIVLLVLGGISATASLVLLFLGLSAKAKGSQGNADT